MSRFDSQEHNICPKCMILWWLSGGIESPMWVYNFIAVRRVAFYQSKRLCMYIFITCFLIPFILCIRVSVTPQDPRIVSNFLSAQRKYPKDTPEAKNSKFRYLWNILPDLFHNKIDIWTESRIKYFLVISGVLTLSGARTDPIFVVRLSLVGWICNLSALRARRQVHTYRILEEGNKWPHFDILQPYSAPEW